MTVANFALNIPINGTSLGQVSISIARELYNRNYKINILPIGQIDFSSQKEDEGFSKWLESSILNSYSQHSRKTPIFKLWHLNGSLESFSEKQILLTFYEVDSPTQTELNIVKNNTKVLLSSKYAISKFQDIGCSNVEYLPLGFDSFNFQKTPQKNKSSIQFGLFGKLEPQRKRHLKTLSLWAKKFGNNQKYTLNCAIYNHFLDQNLQNQMLIEALEGKKYWNINILPYLPQNVIFNDLLNNTDIVLAMSGGEGWGLPEFQAVAMGKHCVGLNAHSYKEWMTEENSVLIDPSTKIPVYDNIFFKFGLPFNQGEIFDWTEESFYEGIDKSLKRFEENPENTAGLELQTKFSYKGMVDIIISKMSEV